MFSDYKVGDSVWIWLYGHDGEMTEGKVVATLDLPDWMFRNFVIEIPTSIDPLLEVRNWMGMRQTAPDGEPRQ